MTRMFPLTILVGLVCLTPVEARDGSMPQIGEQTPTTPKTVGIDQKIGAQLPLDTPFLDENGRRVTVKDCMLPGKPAILVFAYYRCPMLCNVVRNGLLDALRGMPHGTGFEAGSGFSVINIGIDPKEHAKIAAETKNHFVDAYGRPGVETGCHFLTGNAREIEAMTDAAGFRYEYDKVFKEYNHPSGLMILTPDGRVSQYFYGVGIHNENAAGKEYKVPGGTETLRLALVEAADGKLGTWVDKIILSCYRFDHMKQGYALSIMRVVRAGGILTVVLLVGTVVWFRRSERRKSTDQPLSPDPAHPAASNLEGVSA